MNSKKYKKNYKLILNNKYNSIALNKIGFDSKSVMNGYYDSIGDIIDGMVESYQGKYGIITGYSNIDLLEGNDCNEVIKYFTALEMYVERARQTMPQDSYIQNQIDEVTALIVSTIYKLKFLK